MEDVTENLLFANSEVRVVVVRVCAHVDDAVHVQIQIIKLRDLQFARKLFISILETQYLKWGLT